MRNPERFVTFVLGSFVFFFYLLLGYQTIRVGRAIGRSPIVSWTQGGWKGKLWTILTLNHLSPVLAWAYCPAWFRWAPRLAPLELWPIRLLGLFLLCAAAAVVSTAYAELGDSWRIGADRQSPGRLIETGIYASVRHPVYSAFWLWNMGIFLLAPNLMFAALWILGFAGLILQARREEELLLAKYGKVYRDYAARTGRFLPRLTREVYQDKPPL